MGSSEIQGELWGRAPVDWAELMEPVHKPLWEAMLDATQVGEGTDFLDVGCGGGGASILAADRGAQISGLDASEPLLDVARQAGPSRYHAPRVSRGRKTGCSPRSGGR